MLDGQFRTTVAKTVKPIGQSLKKTGLTADHFTTGGLVLSLFTAVAIGLGQLRVGLLLVILTGLCDTLDGAVAKAAGTSSVRGAFFDSVADRVSDSLVLGGLACYVVSVVLWIVALSRVEVSIAYPMLSIGYVVNAIAAYYLLGEQVTPLRFAGIGVIIVGVFIVARS